MQNDFKRRRKSITFLNLMLPILTFSLIVPLNGGTDQTEILCSQVPNTSKVQPCSTCNSFCYSINLICFLYFVFFIADIRKQIWEAFTWRIKELLCLQSLLCMLHLKLTKHGFWAHTFIEEIDIMSHLLIISSASQSQLTTIDCHVKYVSFDR